MEDQRNEDPQRKETTTYSEPIPPLFFIPILDSLHIIGPRLLSIYPPTTTTIPLDCWGGGGGVNIK